MIKLKKVIYILIVFSFLPLFFSKSFTLLAQNTQKTSSDSTIRANTLPNMSDTSKLAAQDTVKLDTGKIKGDISTTILYSAKDSAIVLKPQQMLLLYGDAKITYGDMKIEGAQIEVDYAKNEVTARYVLDSAGKKVGMPVFTDATQQYQAEQMRFNFRTKKGIVHTLVTKQGEGFVHGENVYKDSLDNLYNNKAKYTTCDLPEPHFHIGANKLKMIPNKKVISGPFNLFINDIPTPLGFAFGMFPLPKTKSSGIIVPSYGEARDRGFYLSNGGYYFAASEYYDLALTGDIYSLGGFGLNVQSTYIKKYTYSGNLSFNYNKRKSIIEGQGVNKDFRFSWSHTPVPKGLSRFSASVNLSTNTYSARNSFNPMDRSRSQSSSSVNFSTGFRGTQANLSVNGRLTQDFSTKRVDIFLPRVSFSSGSIFPFKGKSNSSQGVIRQIRTSYSMNADNTITNVVRTPGITPKDSIYKFIPDNFDKFLKYSTNSVTHSIPLSTSIKLLKNITLSPSVSYNEAWHFRYYEKEVRKNRAGIDSAVVIKDTVNGFARNYQYNASASTSTTFYGTFFFKKGKINAIRHMAQPSIGISYSPDFSAPKFGNNQKIMFGGEEKLVSKLDGSTAFVKTRNSAAISFSLSNTLEMKINTPNDSASTTKKLKLLDNFGINGINYNLLADSFNLSNISFSARTRLLDKFDVNFNSTVDPYLYERTPNAVNPKSDRGIRRNKYAWTNGQGIGRMTNAGVAFSTSLNPDFFSKNKKDKKTDSNVKTDEEKAELKRVKDNPDAYVDWDVPWNLSISYNMNYTKLGFKRNEYNHSLNFNGDVSLTKKWKVTYMTSYDLKARKFSDVTSFGILRDLHCWELTVNWSPFGVRSYYNIEIHVKSSILKDLKLTRKKNWFSS